MNVAIAGKSRFSEMSRQELFAKVPEFNWAHAIDLGDGITTPGAWGKGNPYILEALSDIDFQGKKVLDIGCWDGLYSFEAEAKGASEVYSTDVVSQRDFSGQPTFQLAHAALNSKAKYFPRLSVYDIEALNIRDFDVVLFMGVYYHLKDPLRALTALRRVMKDGGLIVVEGCIVEREGCSADFYYQNTICGDNSNWWVPTVECLQQWVTCSFFDIQKEYGRWGHLLNQRHVILGEAVRRDDPLYVRVPEYLEQYSLRRYDE